MPQAFAQKSITLIADPAVIAIPNIEDHELLVDLKNQTIPLYLEDTIMLPIN